MPKHMQEKNPFLHVDPIMSPNILQQLKPLTQNVSFIQSAWKNSIFPKEIHLLGHKKSKGGANTHPTEEEELPNIRSSTPHKDNHHFT